MIRPIEAVWPLRSSRALSLRRKPSSLMAFRTRLAVYGVTPGSSLTTRDTVFSATPARVATSFMVGRPRPGRVAAAPAAPRGRLSSSLIMAASRVPLVALRERWGWLPAAGRVGPDPFPPGQVCYKAGLLGQ
jgi:hypothetical protein